MNDGSKWNVKANKDTQAWDAETDVVIAGAGAAGLSAALEAAHLGAQVMVFEKQPKISDCSTALSGGGVALAGTDVQKAQGISDSDEIFYKDIMDVGKQKNDEKLVRAYVDNQLDAYHWLTGLGVRWTNVVAAAGMSVPRNHREDPFETVKVLKQAAVSKGATVLFRTSVTGLVTDEEGRVIGVRAEDTSGTNMVRARKGVILACGGFGRDLERLYGVDRMFSRVLIASGRGNTGDGHKMAEELGAYLKDMEHVKPSFGMHALGTSAAEMFHGYYHGAIIVNKEGKRFVNESLSYKDIAVDAVEQTGAIGYQLFDKKIYDEGVEVVKSSTEHLPQESKGLDETRINLLVKGDTIEELAVQINIPPAVLEDTVERYNRQVDEGRDSDFGRTSLAGGFGKMARIDTPPFYVYETQPVLVATYGGIAVDENMHVLNRHGRIAGLYAAGEIVGGFHGASYMSGTSIGKSVIFGRIAGKKAAGGE